MRGMPHAYRVRQITPLRLARERVRRADARDPPILVVVGHVRRRGADVAST